VSAVSAQSSEPRKLRRSTTAGRNLFLTLPANARILFIRLRSMGDSLLLTAPLRALKEEFPGFRLSVLVDPAFVGCFEGNPDLKETLATRPTKLRTIAALRRRRFDAVINLHGGPTSLVYALAAKGPSYGFEEAQYPWFYSGVIPSCGDGMHSVELTIERLRWMGLHATTLPSLRFEHNPAAARWVRTTLGSTPYIVIHPATQLATKQWALDRFRDVGIQLNDRGWKLVVTAGPGEEDVAGQAVAGVDRAQILTGLTIPQLAEVIRQADLYIGNDTGPMHLAAAVGTPTVAVWGSSSSATWHPWKVAHRVVQNPFDCNPCSGYRCHVAPTPLCIESVRVDQVTNAVWSLLEECGKRTPVATGSRDHIV